MNEFTLNTETDNIFLIGLSELKGRLDPLYYTDILTYLNKSSYPKEKLYSLSNSLISGFGAGKKDQTCKDNGIIQIRPTNINNEGSLVFEKNVHVLNAVNDNLIIKENDIIFNNTNSQERVGKTAIAENIEDNIYTFSNHITKIHVIESKVLPKFLYIVLNQYQQNKIFYSICTNWNNQSGVGLDLLKNLIIPIPPKEIQEQVVNIYNTAFEIKQQKEQVAKEILASIDKYLLAQLGIELPEKDNSLENRIFTVSLSQISGRFDPKLYDNWTSALRKSVAENKFKNLQLKDLIIQSFAGSWGKDELKQKEDENYKKCLVIRATEFDNFYNLSLDNSRVKYRMVLRKKLQTLDIKSNDLLIEKSGGSPNQPVGRIAIVTNEIIDNNTLCYSNFIHKIRIDSKICNPIYLFTFLKTIHNIGLTEAMQSQTNGIRNLIMSNYFNQIIPIPPIEKQNEISKHISNIRIQAKKLEIEAQETLSQAKSEIEKIILGE